MTGLILNSSVPQAEAPARTPSAPAPDAFPHASTVAAPARRGAATHLTRGEIAAAIAAGVGVALAGTAPAMAASAADAAVPGDGVLVVVLLGAVAVLVVVAGTHGRRPRRRHLADPSSCCLVEHGPADDDELTATAGER